MTNPTPEQSIDVAAVIAELRHQLIPADATASSHIAQSELQVLHEALHEMEMTRVISAHLPIQGHGLVGRVIALSQKIIRRLLRWYINPIVEQQNAFNDATLRTLHLVLEAFEEHQPHLPPRSPHTGTPSAPVATYGDLAQTQAQQAHAEPPLNQWTFRLQDIERQRQRAATVLAHWPLPVRQPIDYVSNALHRLQRIGLRWYINPIVDQMNASNRATDQALHALLAYMQARTLKPILHDIQHREFHG